MFFLSGPNLVWPCSSDRQQPAVLLCNPAKPSHEVRLSPTQIFSAGSVVVPDPGEDKLGVADYLPDKLESNGQKESWQPGVELLRAPEEVA